MSLDGFEDQDCITGFVKFRVPAGFSDNGARTTSRSTALTVTP